MNIRVNKLTGAFDRDVEAGSSYGANTYRCAVPEDLLAGGSYAVNLLMGAGAAALPAASFNTDAAGTEYHHQVVADAYSLSPAEGSTAGGTRVTISGDGFSQERRNNTVSISGAPCVVVSASPEELVCVTSQEPASSGSAPHSGGRGLKKKYLPASTSATDMLAALSSGAGDLMTFPASSTAGPDPKDPTSAFVSGEVSWTEEGQPSKVAGPNAGKPVINFGAAMAKSEPTLGEVGKGCLSPRPQPLTSSSWCPTSRPACRSAPTTAPAP
jgi:hypothetical protein